MSLDAPSPAFSGRVVDHKPGFDVQAGRLNHRAKLVMSKDVPARGAFRLPDIPSRHDIAICLTPPQTIVQKAQCGWKGTVVARVVAVMQVDKDPALRRHQTRKLLENLHAAGRGKDV